MFLAYTLVKSIIKYKYDTCVRCYTQILLMCIDKHDSLNIKLTTMPLPLACIKVITLPHPINQVSCLHHVIQLAWPTDLTVNCYGHVYIYTLPGTVRIPWLISSEVRDRWAERAAGNIEFSLRLYKGCYCDPVVSVSMVSMRYGDVDGE